MPQTLARAESHAARTPTRRARPVIPQADAPLSFARGVWFSLAALVNGVMLLWAASHGAVADRAVDASLIAFCVAVVARHDAFVRACFAVGRSRASYRLHRLTSHLGQLHRAMAIAGTAWFVVALADAAGRGDEVGRALGLSVLGLLLAMAWTSRDRVRHSRHELFEAIHRYGGWTALAILAALVLRQAEMTLPAGAGPGALLAQPPVLLLLVLVALVAEPWRGVRRVPVEVTRVTEQVVVLALEGRRSRGEFVRVSREGREWHSFAVATTGAEGAGRYSLVIRRAGDWTERLARDAECGDAPAHLLVRRIRGRGFMYHAQAYRRVLIVATGAGIGPVLPYLIGTSPVELECLWIGRDHRRAVGDELVDRVMAGGNVTLIDTARGRPDVGARVAERASGFEAVFVVSNHHVRDDVARACRAVGMPWYGPTFDS